VAKVMKEAGLKFDPSVYVPAVAGYYTAPNGQMLSFPFNSSTPVFHYNKDAFKAAGLDPRKPPTTWPEVALAAAKLKASPATSARSPPAGSAGRSWKASRPGTTCCTRPRTTASAASTRGWRSTAPLHVRHIENLANMAKSGLFVYKGRDNAADATFVSGECAMATVVRAGRQRQAQRQVRLRHRHPALLPRRAGRAAEHRDRRRQPVGDVRQEAREYKGVAVLQYLSQPKWRPRATSAPATCR
jgi:ABC-type glycerol-3-phosphate transport system substrate-binding protein